VFFIFRKNLTHIEIEENNRERKSDMGRKELFVGNLSRDVQKRDIEDVFDRYGKLIRCDVKDKGKQREEYYTGFF